MFCKTSFSVLTLILQAGLSIETELLSREKGRGLNDVTPEDGPQPANETDAPKMIPMTPIPSSEYDSPLLQGGKTDVADEAALFPRMVNQKDAKMTSQKVLTKVPSHEKCLAAAKSVIAKVKNRGVTDGVIPGDLVNEQSLKMHNYLRRRHGVPPLKFDQRMRDKALSWATYLVTTGKFEHDKTNGAHDIGENIYHLKTGRSLTSLPVDEVVRSWYEEYKFYTYGWDPEDPAVDAVSHKFGHFTQVVWKDTQKVGCASVNKGDEWVVACNYYPSGNVCSLYAENVLPIRPYYRVADPMRKSVNELINKWRGKKPDSVREGFRKRREAMYDRGDGAMGGKSVTTKTQTVAKFQGDIPQVIRDAFPEGVPEPLTIEALNQKFPNGIPGVTVVDKTNSSKKG